MIDRMGAGEERNHGTSASLDLRKFFDQGPVLRCDREPALEGPEGLGQVPADQMNATQIEVQQRIVAVLRDGGPASLHRDSLRETRAGQAQAVVR